MINQRRGVFGMKDPHGCTGHMLKHIILIREIVRANRVMEEMIGTRIIGIVSRRDENHWQAFGISTRHSVERRKGSNIEGRNDRPNSIVSIATNFNTSSHNDHSSL
jgi:hypothetical protein